MAIRVYLGIGPKPVECAPADLKIDENGDLRITDGANPIAHYVKGFWYGWDIPSAQELGKLVLVGQEPKVKMDA